MNQLDILLDERRQKLEEMREYNRRIDRIIILYLTAVYAAIGLRASDKIDLDFIWNNPQFTVFAFLFIFLNNCILIHAISQNSWNLALAKFVHTSLDEIIKLSFAPPEQCNLSRSLGWDDWRDGLRTLAVFSRNTVAGLWMLLVLGISIYSLKLVNIQKFFLSSKSNASIIVVATMGLLILFWWVFYLGFSEVYLVIQFHKSSENVKLPQRAMCFLSVLITILLFWTSFYLIIGKSFLYG